MASYKDLQSHIRNPTREEFSRHDEVMLKFRDAMWDIGQSKLRFSRHGHDEDDSLLTNFGLRTVQWS